MQKVAVQASGMGLFYVAVTVTVTDMGPIYTNMDLCTIEVRRRVQSIACTCKVLFANF